MNIIVDANVVGGWFFSEPLTSAADFYLNQQYNRFAPELLIYEFTSIVRNKTRAGIITKYQGEEIIKDFHFLNAIQYISNSDLLKKSYQLAIEFNHPVYDCFYQATSIKMNMIMITADRKFYNKVWQSPYHDKIAWIENPPPI